MKRPSILYITPCWPHAKSFGSQMRVLHIARALQTLGELKLAVVDLVGPDQQAIQNTKAEFQVEAFGSVRRVTDSSFSARVRRVVDARVLNPHGLVLEESVRRRIFESLDQFDVIWASHLRTINALERWRWPRSVMDIDDVPSTYERSIWHNGTSLGTRLAAGWRMLVWRRREKLLAERFTVLGVSSEPDRRYLGSIGPIHVIPNGFDRPTRNPERRPATPPRFGFIGKFDYPPNAEGIRWFVNECWPEIKRQCPDARLRLVGLGADGPLKPAGPDIDGLGFVTDPAEEIASWAAMIVPVRIGAGTRVKVLESFSRKCPVVGTRLGVFGHDVTDGRELLLADTPHDFALACLRILQEPAAAEAMSERAWTRFLQEWTWDAGIPRVRAAVEDCLERSGRVSETLAKQGVSGCLSK